MVASSDENNSKNDIFNNGSHLPTYSVLVFKDGTVFEGESKNQQFHGKGKLKHSHGYVLDGNFKNGKFEG